MPHAPSEPQQVAASAAAAQMAARSSSHFTASRLLGGGHQRAERASWSPQQASSELSAAAATTTKHLTHKQEQDAQQHQRLQQQTTTTSTNGGRWRRLGARGNSHEPSLSLSLSSEFDDGDDDDREEQDEDGIPQSTTEQDHAPGGLAGSNAGKPHVGPMGIFFKVWSLVKVTKARHNKMKRQHSEDAGSPAAPPQGGVPAGERPLNGTLPPNCSPLSGQPQTARHILQDAHFRRAGSQPPPTSHLYRQQHQQPAGGMPRAAGDDESPSGRRGLLLLQTSAASSSGATTGTNGSSSGVSSTTSSTLGGGDQLASSATGFVLQQQQPPQQPRPASGKSWAARMKSRGELPPPRQTTTSSAGGSYVSRYRFRRADPDQRQAPPSEGRRTEAAARQASAPHCVPLKQQSAGELAKRQLRAHSEAKQVGGRKSSLVNLRRAGSDDENWAPEGAAGEDEENEEEEEQRTLADSEGAEEDDSDLNDIYSTPNDSIQSMPSGGRLPGGGCCEISQNQQPAQHNKPQVAPYQMTKSFSTNNFTHRISQAKQQQQQQVDAVPFRRIDEHSAQQQQQQQPASGCDERLQQAAAAGRTRSSNGSSRFFISSSSSEDSNTPQQSDNKRQQSTSQTVRQQQQALVAERVPLAVGLHYHAPPTARPNSLALIPATNQLLAGPRQPSSLLTPSGLMMMNGLEPSAVAAMSPCAPLHHGDIFAVHQQMAPQQQQLQPVAGWPPGTPSCQLVMQPSVGYKKSPSLFEMSTHQSQHNQNLATRFSSKYPPVTIQQQQQQLQQTTHQQMSSFLGRRRQGVASAAAPPIVPRPALGVPHSISLHDCKLLAGGGREENDETQQQQQQAQAQAKVSEYRLAQMLLELGAGGQESAPRDPRGYTALMHAILSENLSAVKCLLEHGVDVNATNHEGQSALDLVCSGNSTLPPPAGEADEDRQQYDGHLPQPHLEMLKLLLAHQADVDLARPSDGSRLLDRLIGEHEPTGGRDKLAFIDCLLHNGAKLGSATWAAASGKPEVQLRLLRKLCQDGYFLYKKSSIEAAVYRFEYALRRMSALEQQLDDEQRRRRCEGRRRQCGIAALVESNQQSQPQPDDQADTRAAVQQVKYQTFLGLSRCERKRRFFKRALEFAHMAILVDSTAYEGYYSKAHILKDLGELDDALLAIDQTERLVARALERLTSELGELEVQQEAIVFDGCFQVHDPARARWLETTRAQLQNTLDYLREAQKHIVWLRTEIRADKKRSADAGGGGC